MKKFKALMLVGVFAFVGTGCGSSNDSANNNIDAVDEITEIDDDSIDELEDIEEVSEYQEYEGNEGLTEIILDGAGYEISIPANVDKIISTAPSNTEILVGLGLGDNLVMVDTYAYDVDGIPEDIPFVDFQSPDIEAILSTDFDIIIASEINRAGGVDPFDPIRELGIPVVYIPTSTSIEAICMDIEFLGDVTSTSEKADEIIDDIIEKVDYIKDTVESVDDKKSVFLEISPYPYIFSSGENTFLDQAITFAGGTNIASSEQGWVSLSEEFIIESNPDVIITNASYLEDAVDEILLRDGWDSMDAIVNNEVYLIDNNFSSRPSQYIVNSIEEIATILYPDLF